MKSGPLQITLRQLQRLVFAPRFWGAVVAAAIILAFIGPFGTDRYLDLLPRAGYWFAIAALTFVAGYATVVFLVNLVFPDQRCNPLQVGMIGLAAGIPIAAITILVNQQVFHEVPGTIAGIGETLVNSAVIAGAVSFLYALLDVGDQRTAGETNAAAQTGPVAPATSPDIPPRPGLLDRLKPEMRGRLSHLSMQDHYVEVHTDKGRTLILMRLADAIRETAPVEGLQIHRSHWVARASVRRVTSVNGRMQVEMENGAILPVSRSAQASVRQAGLRGA